MSGFTESVVEEAALEWLRSAGWQIAHGPDIAPDTPAAERADFGEVVLAARLRAALTVLNPDLPAEALDDAFRKLTCVEGADLVQRDRVMHCLLIDGVTVEYREANGTIRGAQARVIDFDDPTSNDWLAVNQFSVVENKHSRRPDIVLFVNGLPLAVLELKNAASENATIWSAYHQLQTYKAEIPSLFASNALLVISDGVETVRKNVTIDWTLRENVRAQLRVLVKRTLRKYGYPPDKQEKATQTVLEQAEVLSQEWVAA